MSHLVLLGDSIFDNAAYVPGRPDVVQQVRNRLPEGWTATLRARDGSVLADIPRQLAILPADATHLVVSGGGNDVLHEVGILGEPVQTVGQSLQVLSDVLERFEADYATMLEAVRDRGLPVAVCTIYNGCSPDPELQREIEAALRLFNDGIIQAARRRKTPVIELRSICTDVADYANPIEPSAAGGSKIAQAIVDLFLRHDFSRPESVLYP